MKIGIIADGDSEVQSLPELREVLHEATGHQMLNPVRLPMTTLASATKLAKTCHDGARQLAKRDADVIIILLDRESREDCPPTIAISLARAINEIAAIEIPLCVVIKDSMFENWLVADPEALRSQSRRYDRRECDRIASAVNNGRADAVAALTLLKGAARGDRYSKTVDSRRILARANINTMAVNSRSFRRFLRCFGHPGF